METYFEISESGDFVRVEALEYAYESAIADWDRNWIKSKVLVKGGSFEGEYAAEFLTIDFERFQKALDSLYDNLTDTVEFKDLEGYLKLKIEGDGNGHFKMTVEASDKPGIYTSYLKFSMEFDQTFIKGFVKQLKNINDEFPVIGTLK